MKNYKQKIEEFKKLNNKIKFNDNNFNLRADGRIEWICSHRTGHTIYAPSNQDYDFIHGCCGDYNKKGKFISCCSDLKILKDKK